MLTQGGEQGLAPETLDAGLAFWLWAALALAGFAGALSLRGRALRIAEDASREEGGGAEGIAPRASEVQANLIIAWALLEGPALAAGVFFILLADTQLLWGALPVYLLGVILTFPRAEWFGAAEAAAGHR